MKNQSVVTHHRLQSIGDILVAMQCHPLDMMRLVIYESHIFTGNFSSINSIGGK